MSKVGVLFIGALGYIAATVMTGALALKRGLCSRAGMVTDLSCFSKLDLIGPADMVFGGWEIRQGSPRKSAYDFLIKNHLLDSALLSVIERELEEISGNIFRGTTKGCGRMIERLASGNGASGEHTLQSTTAKLREDIRAFKDKNGLTEVVVFNIASTEPPVEPGHCHAALDAFEACIADNRVEFVRASTLYTYAALLEGCPYVNFTPSNGALIPALIELAETSGVPVMGNDGKTGETLVKSALAPLFKYRNLEVLSWEGFNILGNLDGRVLDAPENKESKILTKEHIPWSILGYTPHARVHIDYVPSLDDQKTAWNFIHFRGFLGAKMSLQFIWQGYDSILAAPLVLDLIRLMEFAKRCGESGIMRHLASFFKAPLGVNEHRLSEQFGMLADYLEQAVKI